MVLVIKLLKMNDSVSLKLYVLFLFLIPVSSAQVCNPSDQNVLLQLKTILNNPNESFFSDWDPTTSDCCANWFGVFCDSNGRVFSLIVHLVSDTPVRIPPVIGDFPFLQSLDFSATLTGPIPMALSKLTNLQTLHLGNTLTGSIPDFLAHLKQLTSLDLSSNSLTGSIPASLGQLTKLTHLDLSVNSLSGSIPDSLGQLVELDYLSFVFNKLTGPIPASLARLTKITTLQLAANQLTGSIPASFGSFVNNPQARLSFGQNRLSGPLPKSLATTNVSYLDLSSNGFTGDASFLFGKDKTALQTLYLHYNRFKFDFSNVVFPISIINLDMEHNEIYGSLPKQLGQLRWNLIRVNDNRLCGVIPTGRRLKNVSPTEFANNTCLCGVPLPPCKA